MSGRSNPEKEGNETMNTRTKILLAALMVTAVGVSAVPTFADSANRAAGQVAFNGPGRGGPGWHDGRGPRGDRDGDAQAFGWGRGDRDGHGMGGPRGGGMSGFGMGPGGMGDGPRGGGMTGLVERFDANKDGTITKDEIATVNVDRVKAYDTDGDGALSLTEFTVLWTETNKERIVRDFQQRDPNGDAKVTLDEYSKPFDQMFAALDNNNDGSIDANELRAPRDGRGPGFGKRGPGDQAPPAMRAPDAPG